MAQIIEHNEKLLPINYKKEVLRKKREPLLEAFDKWEKAVLRGREQDNQAIMTWYRSILDLDSDGSIKDMENIPERISYFMKKEDK